MNKFWTIETFDDSCGAPDWFVTDDIFFKSRENAVEYAEKWNAKVRRDWRRKVEGARRHAGIVEGVPEVCTNCSQGAFHQVCTSPIVGEVRVIELTFKD